MTEESDIRPPLFVLGTPRSGTTLTAKLLGSHPELFMPGETHFFPDIYAKSDSIGSLHEQSSRDDLFQRLATLYGRYNEPDDQKRIDALLGAEEKRKRLIGSLHDYRDALDTFMLMQMESEGKRRWGNNTPKDIFYIDEILDFYPDVKIILCVRDIRDFLNSYKSKWKVTADDQAERLKRLYHPIITALLWKSSMRSISLIKKKVKPENLLIQKYEDLVSDADVAVRQLCEFIGESYYPQMLDIQYSNSSDRNASKGVYATSVEKWRGQLSQEEVYLSQRIAGSEMIGLGYELSPTRASPLKVMLSVTRLPVSLYRALSANRENTGPIIPYLMRRVRTLIFGNCNP